MFFKPGKGTNYSKPDNWSKCETSGTKPADTFFITGTMMMKSQGTDDGTVCINDELRKAFDDAYEIDAMAYDGVTNMYVPYYRQMDYEDVSVILDEGGAEGFVDALRNSGAYLDITAALDYYFGNYNKGKPFIIAGQSQGSAIIRSVLSDYMYQHPEYYKRMVAAYGIGYGFPESYFKSYPHVKTATGETDTRVVISFNLESPGATMPNKLVEEDNCLCINPLNWKLDDTYAPETENIGAVFDGELLENFADAQNDLNRHTLITNADLEPHDPKYGFGDKSLHGKEHRTYCMNIKDNVVKRVAAFAE